MSNPTNTNTDTRNTDAEPWSWAAVDPAGTIRQREVEVETARLIAMFG